MKIAGIHIRRRFFVSVGLVVAITGVWLYWSRLNQPKIAQASTGQAESFVRIAGGGQDVRDEVMEERAEYFDPTPLFLPTSRNFQQGVLPARVVKQPGQVFRDFEPKLNFAESALPDYGSMDGASGNSLSEVMTGGNVAPYAGFGQIDESKQSLAKRGGYIEVKTLKNGVLSSVATLSDAELPSADFSPIEFIVAVASAGLIGDPVISATSGSEEVDGKLKDYLVNVYRIGERLAPGRYVIVIGP